MTRRSRRSLTTFGDSNSDDLSIASGHTLVGVLTPLASASVNLPKQIGADDCIVGRGGKSDGVDLCIEDKEVSRRHARIRSQGSHFIIEDLDSVNGTFVDGIPVRQCLLSDGDTIQFGSNLFAFERVFEFEGRTLVTGEAAAAAGNDAPTQSASPPEGLTLRFWGTRGSLPTPGEETAKYGGNTSCMELRYGETILVIDSGSGIRELSKSLAAEFAGGPLKAHLLFTHLHWDHIQGFPFFGMAYQKGNQISIYGGQHEAGTTQELLSGQMRGPYFPVPISEMKADIQFHDLPQKLSIGGINIESFDLPHPGGCVGFRISTPDSVLVVVTDSEFDQIALNREEVLKEHQTPRRYDSQILELLSNADLMVIDSQYSDEQYPRRIGWGHNSTATIVDLCRQTLPGIVALFHHDPESSDEIVTQRVRETKLRLSEQGINEVLVCGAREKMTLNVAPPLHPSRIR